MTSETYEQRARIASNANFKAPAERVPPSGELMALRGVSGHIQTRRLNTASIRRSERKTLADRYISLVNLRRFEKAYVHELSGGMKQRAQLARALAVEPRMLLMDAPFAALDAQTRDVLQQEFQEITTRLRTTVIFVTHNVREADILADRVVVMTPAPGRLKTEIAIPLPRPRGPDSHAVVDLAARVRAELQHDIYAAQAAEDSYAI